MSLYDDVVSDIKNHRQRIIEGKSNCLPFPYPRFRRYYQGLERAKFIIITGNQKTAKSKWANYTFLYEPFFNMLENPDSHRIKGFIFTLEISKKAMMYEFFSHLLFRLSEGDLRYSPKDLKSLDEKHLLPQKVLDVIEGDEFKGIVEKWLECVEYIDDVKNPTGVNKYLREWALRHGHFETWKDETGAERIGKYIPDDPELYKIVVLDNAANLTQESGMSEMENISKMSKYFITLRDQLEFSIVFIQHQAQSQESLENFKYNKVEPSSAGLGDSKRTSRDANMVFGIYSPFKHDKPDYKEYNITRLRNYGRFVKVLEDRDGESTGEIIPLLFDGAVTIFDEMPKPDDPAVEDCYKYAESCYTEEEKPTTLFMLFSENKPKEKLFNQIRSTIFTFLSKIKSKIWQ